MTKEEIEKQLEALVKGEILTIEVKKEDFLVFRECWLSYPEKPNIIGRAKRNGNVEYYYKAETKKPKLE